MNEELLIYKLWFVPLANIATFAIAEPELSANEQQMS